MTPTPDTEPLALRAGDSAAWTRSLPEFSADDGWALHYRLIPPTAGTPIDINAAGTGTDHAVTLDAATTAAWPAGAYTRYTYVDRTLPGPIVERVSLGMAQIEIQPDLATATAYDGRSLNVRTLADLETALATYSASHGTVAEYSIGDKHMKFRSPDEITALIAIYKRAVAKERAVSGRVFYRG